jgi:hypothetical protein
MPYQATGIIKNARKANKAALAGTTRTAPTADLSNQSGNED